MANKGLDINKILRAGISGGVTLWIAPYVLSWFGVTLTVSPPGFIALFIAGAVLNAVLDPIADAMLRNVG